jgi:hypothetical protein
VAGECEDDCGTELRSCNGFAMPSVTAEPRSNAQSTMPALRARKMALTGVAAFSVALVLAPVLMACSSSPTRTGSSAPAATHAESFTGTPLPADTAVTFTPAEHRFLNRVRPVLSGNDEHLIAAGQLVCSDLQGGMTYAEVANTELHGGSADGKRTIIIASVVAFCPGEHGKIPKPLTVAEEQVIQSAKGYLAMGSGFSRAGLIEQLSSNSGEGFSHKLAVFAVKYLHPNWNQQAVLSAKSYMQMGGFSRASLIDQLHSASGEGFTLAQAVYAANHVGLR